jgi:hypothetical protein
MLKKLVRTLAVVAGLATLALGGTAAMAQEDPGPAAYAQA